MKKQTLLIVLAYILLVGCVLSVPRPTAEPALPSTSQSSPTPEGADLAPYRQAMLPAYTADVDRLSNATRYWIELEHPSATGQGDTHASRCTCAAADAQH